jgi:predicted transcriptional regulator
MKTQSEIAEALDISQATVSRDLTAIQKEWAQARINDIDERKRVELAKIDNLELEYWEGWKRSQESVKTETQKMQGSARQPKAGEERNDTAPDKLEKINRVESQIGDPRFLAGIQSCINKRCELLGLNAPTKTEVKIDDLTDEERINKVLELLDTARERANGQTAKRNQGKKAR